MTPHRLLIVLGCCAVLVPGPSAGGLIDCPNEPDLAVRAQAATLILVGSIDRVEDPNHVMPPGPVELGTSYGGNVRVIFSAREVLKGQFHQRVVFDCYQGIGELNGCTIPWLKPGKLAVIFLSGNTSPLSLVAGSYGVAYPKPNELAELKENVSRLLAKAR